MPKVLIKKSSNPHSWYVGDVGKMFDLKGSDEKHYLVPLGGLILKTEAELLYTEAEYNEIMQQRNKAIDDLAKHAQTIVDMQKEKLRLQDEVDQAMQRDRVELPRDVFNAIESFRDNGWSPEDIFLVSDRPDDGEWAATLYKWRTSSASAGRKLLNALVNGYTVEQTPAERLQADIHGLLKNWLGSNLDEKAIDQLTSQLLERATQLT